MASETSAESKAVAPRLLASQVHSRDRSAGRAHRFRANVPWTLLAAPQGRGTLLTPRTTRTNTDVRLRLGGDWLMLEDACAGIFSYDGVRPIDIVAFTFANRPVTTEDRA